MARETEIKLRIEDPRAFERKLNQLGARPLFRKPVRVHEMNAIFDTAERDLLQHGHLLRIRTQKVAAAGYARDVAKLQRSLVTFKRPVPVEVETKGNGASKATRYKTLEEIELHVADPEAMARVFEGLGLGACFRYEKFRSTYRFPRSMGWAKSLLIELDETPIGFFAELEGPAQAIDRAARLLGFTPGDYLQSTYFDLYFEDCRQSGRAPADMLFETGR